MFSGVCVLAGFCILSTNAKTADIDVDVVVVTENAESFDDSQFPNYDNICLTKGCVKVIFKKPSMRISTGRGAQRILQRGGFPVHELNMYRTMIRTGLMVLKTGKIMHCSVYVLINFSKT